MDTRVKNIIKKLNKRYPNPKPFLNFRTPFELLVATMLAAQCTDARVNIVTKDFFKAASTPEGMLKLGETKITKYVKPTGFYRNKTKNILELSRALMEKYKSKVPKSLEELVALPGVGRKTASCILAQGYKIPAFPVDRHVLRVANRLALAKHPADPEKTDIDLRKNIPEKYWIPLHLQLVSLGREICRPKPKCEQCPLLIYCPEGQRRKKKGFPKK